MAQVGAEKAGCSPSGLVLARPDTQSTWSDSARHAVAVVGWDEHGVIGDGGVGAGPLQKDPGVL